MAFKIPREQTGDRQLNQIQQNIAGAIEPLFMDLSGSFLVGLSGCTAIVEGLAYWQRATANGPPTIQFPSLFGTSNTTTAMLTGLPSFLWPTTDQTVILRTADNGTTAFAIGLIETGGIVLLYSSATSAVFTGSGTKGVASSTVTYLL